MPTPIRGSASKKRGWGRFSRSSAKRHQERCSPRSADPCSASVAGCACGGDISRSVHGSGPGRASRGPAADADGLIAMQSRLLRLAHRCGPSAIGLGGTTAMDGNWWRQAAEAEALCAAQRRSSLQSAYATPFCWGPPSQQLGNKRYSLCSPARTFF
jgi:hypothetical protein